MSLVPNCCSYVAGYPPAAILAAILLDILVLLLSCCSYVGVVNGERVSSTWVLVRSHTMFLHRPQTSAPTSCWPWTDVINYDSIVFGQPSSPSQFLINSLPLSRSADLLQLALFLGAC